MKRVIRYMALLSAVLMLCCMFAACNSTGLEPVEGLEAPQTSSDDADWADLTDATYWEGNGQDMPEKWTLTKGDLVFELELATGHFSITNTAINKTYYSIPQGKVAGFNTEKNDRLTSELSLVYYNANSEPFYMATNPDSPNNEVELRIVFDGNNTVRLYYQLGEDASDKLAPDFFVATEFDELLTKKGEDGKELLSSANQRRLKRVYELFDKNQLESDSDKKKFEEMLKKYPVLETTPLYIFKSNATEIQRVQTAEAMKAVGYTVDDYLAGAEELGIEVVLELGPGFIIPVQYTLDDSAFTATILSDKIEENSQNFKMTECNLLEYFASVDKDGSGHYLVPDGSGALVQINNPVSEPYSQPLYGADFVAKADKMNQINKNALLPVYGIMEGDGTGIFSIVEGGAAAATVKANTYGTSHPVNHIYTTFQMRVMDVTEVESVEAPVFNLYGKHILYEFPQVRFNFVAGEDATYSGMAQFYRAYLLEKNLLNKSVKEGAPALYIDMAGLYIRKASFLGISYDESVRLSSLEEIQAVVDRLNEAGVNNTVLRLNGYGKGGLNNYAYNRFDLNGLVGKVDQLKALGQQIKDKGGRLYLDADFSFVYSDGWFDGFTPKENGARYLTRTVVLKGDYDRVTRKYLHSLLARWFVSSASYLDFATDYVSSLREQMGADATEYIGVSYGSAGLILGSDNNRKYDLDRAQSAQLIRNAMSTVKEDGVNIVTDGGNMYTLSYADTVLNVPMYSSGINSEVAMVPFYQMVVHGYVDYAGTPFNLSVNNDEALLKAVEYGAGLYYSWMTGPDSLLAGGDFAIKLYSLDYRNTINEAIDRYKELAPFYEAVATATIVKHEEVQHEVYRTTYSNGVTTVVNYGVEAVVVDGVEIAARDYHINMG